MNRLLRFAPIAGAALLPLLAVPAEATPQATSPASALVLTVNHGESVSSTAKRVLLTCDPHGGTHPFARVSCAELASANGDVAALKIDPDRACTLIYDPVTVSATGVWRGRQVRQQLTYGNECALHAQTGHVFRF